MDKIRTIIVREYLTRVKSRAFILSTFLSPFLLGLLFFIPILAANKVEKEEVTVFVADGEMNSIPYKYLQPESDSYTMFLPAVYPESWYRDSLKENEAYLIVPQTFFEKKEVTFTLRSRHALGLGVINAIERKVDKAVREFRLDSAGLTQAKKEMLDVKVSLRQAAFDGNEELASAKAASLLGYGMGFIIYMLLIFYGVSVMRGVVEEKASRIAEVMLSTVRPFELMMGKIIGIGMAGLTQFLIWIGMTFLVIFVSTTVAIASGLNPQAGTETMDPAQVNEANQMFQQVFLVLNLKTILLFLFYFLGGYLMFGSLFAAVGSAVDTEADSQQLTWPVMLPLIIPMMLMGNIIQNPSGMLARFLSIFPLFSPTTMMVRYASKEVPGWELALSMVLLLAGFVGGVFLAARIYRVGILMYGKKVTLRELWRWLRHY